MKRNGFLEAASEQLLSTCQLRRILGAAALHDAWFRGEIVGAVAETLGVASDRYLRRSRGQDEAKLRQNCYKLHSG